MGKQEKNRRRRLKVKVIKKTEASECKNFSFFENLPLETLCYIFSLFDVHTLLTCMSVCKLWLNVGSHPNFWSHLNLQRFSCKDFPPLSPWNPLNYYNLFDLIMKQGRELSNYEFFNCSQYCHVLQEKFGKSKFAQKCNILQDKLGKSKLGKNVIKAKQKFNKVQKRIGLDMRDRINKVQKRFGLNMRDRINKVQKRFGLNMKDRIMKLKDNLKKKVNRLYLEAKSAAHKQKPSNYCIAYQLRNFVLFSVLLQHIAFSSLLWRHWNKTSVACLGKNWLFYSIFTFYWILAISSILSHIIPESISYIGMSLILVHLLPLDFVVYDLALLLLTIFLANIAVNDIYNRYPEHFLLSEKTLLKNQYLLLAQTTIFLIFLLDSVLIFSYSVIFVTSILILKILRAKRFNKPFYYYLYTLNGKYALALKHFSFHIVWTSVVTYTCCKLDFSMAHLIVSNHSKLSLIALPFIFTLNYICFDIILEHRYEKVQMTESKVDTEEQEQGELQNLLTDVEQFHEIRDERLMNEENHLLNHADLNEENFQDNSEQEILDQAFQTERGIEIYNQDSVIENRNETENLKHLSMAILHPTIYWHYVWILGVACDFSMGFLTRLGFEPLAQTLSLILPFFVLVGVLPVQIYYWNRKWNYDLNPVCDHPRHKVGAKIH